MKTIRWGILGCGHIADKFAESLPNASGAVLLAAGSRDEGRARQFAGRWNAERAYGEYSHLVRDPDVDVVYIATTNNTHYPLALSCLRAGKAVLLEKPFTINRRQAETLTNIARKDRIFLMEARWSRFFPAAVDIVDRVLSNQIGDVRVVHASIGQGFPTDPEHRLFNPQLGGGALMDLGVYVLDFAIRAFGDQPASVRLDLRIGPTGVDETAGLLLDFGRRGHALLSAAVNVPMPHDGWIFGTEGWISVPSLNRPERLEITSKNGESMTANHPYPGPGYHFEADEVMRCLREGRTESAVMPLDDTLVMMDLLDGIRRDSGLVFPRDIEVC